MSISSERIAALRDYVPEVRELTIDGKPVKPAGETWDVYNPATEEVIATVSGATKEQVDEAIRAARTAFDTWSKMSGEERSAAMHSLADRLEPGGRSCWPPSSTRWAPPSPPPSSSR